MKSSTTADDVEQLQVAMQRQPGTLGMLNHHRQCSIQ
jgi:hypothetical protein